MAKGLPDQKGLHLLNSHLMMLPSLLSGGLTTTPNCLDQKRYPPAILHLDMCQLVTTGITNINYVG